MALIVECSCGKQLFRIAKDVETNVTKATCPCGKVYILEEIFIRTQKAKVKPNVNIQQKARPATESADQTNG